MVKENLPDGVKRNQNGSIGEARTKALLMDRFWILERSVDIHGADFIIQRKLHSHNLLSETPTRFGIVQSKCSQNYKTQHLLHKRYVLNNNEEPHLEFFLIVNIGIEDEQHMGLLSATAICNGFDVDEKGFYKKNLQKV